MTLLDYIIIVIYLLLTILIGFWVHKKIDKNDFLLNAKQTSLKFMICTTVSSWIGAGAIVGVCSAAFKSGISYGISVAVIIATFFAVFAFFSAKIKEFGDVNNAYTIGDFFLVKYGKTSQVVYSFFSFSSSLLWVTIQLVALSQLMQIITGFSNITSLFISVLITVSYSTFGGLKSDIITDFFQFWVMLVGFLIMLPIVYLRVGEAGGISSLEPRFFDPLAFGGATFLIGGVLIGSIYPFANVQEWQRVFSCKDSKIAKRAYLYGIPLVFFYVGSAVFFGLATKVLLPNVSSEQALFELINKTLPVGVIGISFACILSVIMSSVDSLLVGATATLANDILPHIKISNNQSKEKYLSISSLRVVSFLIALPCALIAYLYPSIVSLSIIASFLLLCFSPVIILGLLGVKLTQKKVVNSMVLGIIGLVVGWYYLGTSSFVVILVGTIVGILI